MKFRLHDIRVLLLLLIAQPLMVIITGFAVQNGGYPPNLEPLHYPYQ